MFGTIGIARLLTFPNIRFPIPQSQVKEPAEFEKTNMPKLLQKVIFRTCLPYPKCAFNEIKASYGSSSASPRPWLFYSPN